MKCKKCEQEFTYEDHEAWWDYKGVSYDTKLVKCKHCDQINIVEYWFMPNRERWYYEYEKKED